VGTRTLQGLARGGSRTRVGFEYTVPITVGRFLRRAPAAPPEALQPDSAGVVELEMNAIAYTRPHIVIPAGTTVRWVNRDPVAHTVTADNASFDSDLVQPGVRWERRFDQPGTYRYHCTPHPFMRGIVVVR
jgi:plastocyanin